MTWLSKSILAMFLFCPFVIYSNVAGRMGVKGEPLTLYWLFGSGIGLLAYIIYKQPVLIAPNIHLGLAALVGITTGAFANLLIIQAIIESPNPGLPVAIVSLESVVVYVVTPILVFMLPRYFKQIRFDIWTLFGICLAIAGLSIIMIRSGRA